MATSKSFLRRKLAASRRVGNRARKYHPSPKQATSHYNTHYHKEEIDDVLMCRRDKFTVLKQAFLRIKFKYFYARTLLRYYPPNHQISKTSDFEPKDSRSPRKAFGIPIIWSRDYNTAINQATSHYSKTQVASSTECTKQLKISMISD